MSPHEATSSRSGVAFGIGAYILWGLSPIYFKFVGEVANPGEVLAHRIVWSLVFLLMIVVALGKLKALRKLLFDPRRALWLLVSSILISANWLIYIYAIATGRILETSLAYFATPLMNIAMGLLILRERLRRWQSISLLLAAAGLVVITLRVGTLPWIALSLSVSFAIYGLVRKMVVVPAVEGLTVETMLLAPLGLGYLIWLERHGGTAFLEGTWDTRGLLALAGVVTSMPLLLFAGAVRRLRLTTIGFLQYLSPSIAFLVAVFLYDEALAGRLIGFVFIWTGLALYTWDAARHTLRQRHGDIRRSTAGAAGSNPA